MSNMVVVDASLALKWVIDEPDALLARLLLKQWIQQRFMLLTPDLLLYEITNILYKRIRKEEISVSGAIAAFNILMQGSLNIKITDEIISLQALDIAHRYKLPATYDAHYLALAENEQCEFWTADKRLYNSVKGQLSWVHLVSELAPASTI